MSRTSPGHLDRLLASGKMAEAARASKTQAEMAAKLGVSSDAITGWRIRRKARGQEAPTFEQLKQWRGVMLSDAQYEAVRAVIGAPGCGVDPQKMAAAFSALDGVDIDVSDLGEQPDVPLPAIPAGHRVHKVSTLIDTTTGESKLQWIKTSAVNDERADWLEAIRDMGGELPRVEPVAAPHAVEDMLVVVPVGDPHVGLLSWREDAGENFDLEIAERRLVSGFSHLLGLAPPAKECLLILIGDTAHADGQSNTTTKGTRVDVDGRIIKVARTILRICRHAIGLALQRHERVTMIVERGNHDELVSAMIALALAQHYEHEPRVTIDQSPAMFHWFRWGSVLIGTHHGDKVKPMDLLGVMAVDQAEAWSQCKHRRFYLGHVHHQMVKEVPGLICEYLPTLASSDAWHHSMGYRSSKAMYLDVYHREHGHVDRHIVGISQLRAA